MHKGVISQIWRRVLAKIFMTWSCAFPQTRLPITRPTPRPRHKPLTSFPRFYLNFDTFLIKQVSQNCINISIPKHSIHPTPVTASSRISAQVCISSSIAIFLFHQVIIFTKPCRLDAYYFYDFQPSTKFYIDLVPFYRSTC